MSCDVEKIIETKLYVMPIPHSHNYYELYILTNGKRNFEIENDSHAMNSCSMVIIPPNVPHKTYGGGYTRYLVNFTKDFMDENQSSIVELCQQQVIDIKSDEEKHIVQILEFLLYLQSNQGKKKTLMQYHFNNSFSYLISYISQLSNFPSKKFVPKNQYSLLTKNVIYYLNENYNKKITLDMLSKKFFVSKPSLCKKFKRDTGFGIIDYLLQTRLAKAKSMLAFSDTKIGEIAYLCGFSSPMYFYCIFKQQVKQSPSEYRKDNHINF